ncbi:uncharacterized protein LOC108713924 [Xenopus laevis]|uniref:Uncharacterized protein LOC108713924 n=1 Tax=Xenopus laevis TaxID=8355 RepID=A0A8J0V0P3_XENLA|nr:uncharacterized protein LOC108713924 [Xenopus laevis]XP_018113149.1 uncharacterized protein LOC108713924 [Xenopus laevis]XP_018113150.1 uncharacterized protein LOC108713924 [Xenopus laevis]XP_041445948.1 uncharacterized protein LOC108713924 [Xenopus laevis]
MPNCIVKGCPHRSGQKLKYPDVTLHPFPHNLHQIKKWLLQTGQHGNDLESLADKILRGAKNSNFRMCSTHFSEEYYTFKGSKRMLKPNAVPTIFYTSPVLPIIRAQSTSVPAAKRMRVDDPEPSTSFTVVRVVSRLITVGTQTDHRRNRTDVSTMTKKLSKDKDVATQTEPPVKMEIAIQTGDDSIEAELWKVQKDHIYPVCFIDPYKSIDPLESISESKESHSAKGCLSTLHTSKGESSQNPTNSLEGFSTDQNFLNQTTESLEQSTVHQHRDYVRQRKFIIFEENLDSLLYLIKCQHPQTTPCQAPILNIQKFINGSMIQVRLLCLDGHKSLIWNSQPLSGDISVGNVLLANSVLVCGLSFQKVKKMLDLLSIPFFSQTTYCKYQMSYLFPSIDLQWRHEQESTQKELSGKSVALAGDCQFDTPVHSTKYCTYTMMDVMSKKILSFTIDQLGKGKTSVGLEKATFETCLDKLLDDNIDVKIIATSRHDGIEKLVATKYSSIDHQIDVWNLCKSVSKKLVAASKKRDCRDICKWISAITNHLWWCAQTCNQDVDVLLDKWKSVMFHIANKHRFHSLENYKHCQHKRLNAVKERKCAWITSEHPAHTPLSRIINDQALLRDISKIEKFCHTRDLESFHSKVLKYKSKRSAFSMDSVYTDTILAALSHNRNVSREDVNINCAQKSPLPFGEKRCKVAFSKSENRDDKFVGEDVVENYLLDIMSNSLKILNGELVNQWSSRSRILR